MLPLDDQLLLEAEDLVLSLSKLVLQLHSPLSELLESLLKLAVGIVKPTDLFLVSLLLVLELETSFRQLPDLHLIIFIIEDLPLRIE